MNYAGPVFYTVCSVGLTSQLLKRVETCCPLIKGLGKITWGPFFIISGPHTSHPQVGPTLRCAFELRVHWITTEHGFLFFFKDWWLGLASSFKKEQT